MTTGEQEQREQIGAAIRRARERARPKLSVREAARRAGISESYWRSLEKGWSTAGDGVQITASHSDEVIASAARAVGLDSAELVVDILGHELHPPLAPDTPAVLVAIAADDVLLPRHKRGLSELYEDLRRFAESSGER